MGVDDEATEVLVVKVESVDVADADAELLVVLVVNEETVEVADADGAESQGDIDFSVG